MTVTTMLAQYALGLRSEDVAPEAWEQAKRFFMDGLGCLLAGARERPCDIALDYAKTYGGAAVSTVLGRKGVRTDPANALTINGIAAHFHDVDDVLVSIDGHPSAVLVPAVLTAAEQVKASGKDTLMAYLTGVEVLRLVGEGLNHEARYYCLGWHSTSTLGIFGATAAIGRLYGLTERELVYALGIAASESSGLKNNFGTMVKPLHAGRAAAKAFFAVQMAKRGYISSPEVIEGNEGFAHVTVKEVDVERMKQAIDEGISAFLQPGLTMKPWPCCKQNHSAIEAVQNLLRYYKFTADDVERVCCRMQPVSLDCLKYHAPTTKLQGKFSIQYNIAVALLRGEVTLADYDGVEITEPEVLDLIPRIEGVLDDSIANGAYNNGKYDSIVDVYLKDGRVLSEWVEYAKGDPQKPMSEEEVTGKFIAGMSRSCEDSPRVVELVKNIDHLDCITELFEAVEAAARA